MILSRRRIERDKPMISVLNVSAGYGDGAVVSGVSFEVSRGEIVAILGPSGCGKTTLFKVMTGLLHPMEGEVLIQGKRMVYSGAQDQEGLHRAIGVTFQSGALFSSLTLAENVALPLRLNTKLPEETIEQIVAMKLAQVGLSGYDGFLPAEISGGMKKRVAIARAMVMDPPILFLDEPSAGLDPVTSAKLDDTILEINRNLSTTMVVVTHELASIMAIADTAIMLDPEERTVIAQAAPMELKNSSDDPRVRDFFNRSPSGRDEVEAASYRQKAKPHEEE